MLIQTHMEMHMHTSTQAYRQKLNHIVQIYTNTFRHHLQRDTQKCTHTYGQTHPDTYGDGHTYVDTCMYADRNTQIKSKTQLHV